MPTTTTQQHCAPVPGRPGCGLFRAEPPRGAVGCRRRPVALPATGWGFCRLFAWPWFYLNKGMLFRYDPSSFASVQCPPTQAVQLLILKLVFHILDFSTPVR